MVGRGHGTFTITTTRKIPKNNNRIPNGAVPAARSGKDRGAPKASTYEGEENERTARRLVLFQPPRIGGSSSPCWHAPLSARRVRSSADEGGEEGEKASPPQRGCTSCERKKTLPPTTSIRNLVATTKCCLLFLSVFIEFPPAAVPASLVSLDESTHRFPLSLLFCRPLEDIRAVPSHLISNGGATQVRKAFHAKSSSPRRKGVSFKIGIITYHHQTTRT